MRPGINGLIDLGSFRSQPFRIAPFGLDPIGLDSIGLDPIGLGPNRLDPIRLRLLAAATSGMKTTTLVASSSAMRCTLATTKITNEF